MPKYTHKKLVIACSLFVYDINLSHTILVCFLIDFFRLLLSHVFILPIQRPYEIQQTKTRQRHHKAAYTKIVTKDTAR